MKKQIQFKIRSKWCLALLLAMFSATTYSQQSLRDQFNVDGITYKIASPTEVEVVGYTGTAKEVTVPQTSNDQGTHYTVTAIGNDAFAINQLTKVTIHSTVISIGETAFNLNYKLTSANIPENVTGIEQWTFGQNDLKEVTIPANVEIIGLFPFQDKQDLHLVTVQANHQPVFNH